jgi:KaiC/GvpD/RAD55 family RecA-like ATPase
MATLTSNQLIQWPKDVVYRDVVPTGLQPANADIPMPAIARFPLKEKLQNCPYSNANSKNVPPGVGVLEALLNASLSEIEYRLPDPEYMRNMFTLEAAELALWVNLFYPTQAQRFFATGGDQNFTMVMARAYNSPLSMPSYLKFDDTYNLPVLQPEVRYWMLTIDRPYGWPTNLAQIPFFQGCARPLLRLASYYNQIPLNELGMAKKICDMLNINPMACTESSFGIDSTCPIQFSALNNQYVIQGKTFDVMGEGSCPHYRIVEVRLENGKIAFLPVQPVCMIGHSLTMPMFLPPSQPHFINEDQIGSNRFIVLTSHPEVISAFHFDSDCVFLSDYDLAGNIDRLPWELLRGKTVHYLLPTTPDAAKEEADLAVRACSKIRDAGYGHTHIIDCNGSSFIYEQAEIFSDNEFGKLVDKYGSSITLWGFIDCRPPREIPEGRITTAFPYLQTRQLVEILGERGSGKTWCALLYALLLTQDDGLSVYFHGEGRKDEIRQRLQRLGTCLRTPDGNPLDDTDVVTVDLATAPCVTENGFDLKAPACQKYIEEQISSLRKASGKAIGTVVFDNYATLAGDSQEGKLALPVLTFLRNLRCDNDFLVILVCHTNTQGFTAASSHLERQAEVIMKVSKNPEWQQKLRAQMNNKSGKDNALTKEEQAEVICDEIDAAEAERSQVILNLEFTKIREGAQLNPREIRIDLETNVLVDKEVDGEMKKDFVRRLATKEKLPVPDAPAFEMNSAEAPVTYKELKEQDSEGVRTMLKEIVEVMRLQVRPELAKALHCSKSSLDTLMQGHKLCNADIGLKKEPGRKKHR